MMLHARPGMAALGAATALLLLAITMLSACGANFTTNSYRTLSTAAATYDAGLKTAADLHSRGLITDEQKHQVIEIATRYRMVYQAAVSALAAYERNKTELTAGQAEEALTAFAAVYGELVEILAPLLTHEGGRQI